jgi:hypothetical protein
MVISKSHNLLQRIFYPYFFKEIFLGRLTEELIILEEAIKPNKKNFENEQYVDI